MRCACWLCCVVLLRRGSGRKKKKKSKEQSQEELARLLQQQEPWMPELPPHLQRYKLNLKHDVSSHDGLLGIEDDEGCIEYKLKLLEPTPSRYHQLVRQGCRRSHLLGRLFGN